MGAGCARPGPVHDGPGVGTGAATGVGATLEWSVSPWRERPWMALAAAAGALGLWLFALAWLPGERLAATALGVLCLAALAPGMSPTRCRVDGEGVGRGGTLGWERRRWADVRRARLGARGLFVSPLERPGRLDRFRGLFLPLPRDDARAGALRRALGEEVRRRGL